MAKKKVKKSSTPRKTRTRSKASKKVLPATKPLKENQNNMTVQFRIPEQVFSLDANGYGRIRFELVPDPVTETTPDIAPEVPVVAPAEAPIAPDSVTPTVIPDVPEAGTTPDVNG